MRRPVPVEAGLVWSIQKRRRNEGGFPGADAHPGRTARTGPTRARRHQARRPRAGARRDRDLSLRAASAIGVVTSGGFGPSVNAPVAMGYVARRIRRSPARPLQLVVRGKRRCRVPHRSSAPLAASMPTPLTDALDSLPSRPMTPAPSRGKDTMALSASPRTTSTSASTAISPPSASPTTRRPARRHRVRRAAEAGRKAARAARPSRSSRASRPRATCSRLCPARSSRSTRALPEQPALVNEDAEGKALVLQDEAGQPGRTRRLDGPRRLRGVREGDG